MRPSSFQFTDPVLTRLNFSSKLDFKPNIENHFSLDNNISTVIKKSVDQPNAVVEVTLTVNADSGESPFSLTAAMMANFRWAQELEEPKVKALLSQNAVALLISYLRPIVAYVTNVSPFPVYNLPFMNLNEPDANTHSDESSLE